MRIFISCENFRVKHNDCGAARRELHRSFFIQYSGLHFNPNRSLDLTKEATTVSKKMDAKIQSCASIVNTLRNVFLHAIVASSIIFIFGSCGIGSADTCLALAWYFIHVSEPMYQPYNTVYQCISNSLILLTFIFT